MREQGMVHEKEEMEGQKIYNYNFKVYIYQKLTIRIMRQMI